MKDAIAFAAGALLGAGIIYFFLKDHFAHKAQEDIDSVIQAFHRDDEKKPEESEESTNGPFTETSSIDSMKDAYKVKLKDYRSTFEAKTKEDEMMERAKSTPYVISPAEVNYDEYDEMELIWYADGVLADPDDYIVEDIVGLVGHALNHFGEYEDDTVIVNNDRLKLCIEITRDSRTYTEVTGIESRPSGKRKEDAEDPHEGGD